jgi:hypothetical protein
MTPVISQLFSSCRERNLRTLDPNVPDENYLFLVTNTVPELGSSIWKSFDNSVQMNPLTGWTGFYYTWMPDRSIFAGFRTQRFGYGFVHPSATSSGELYLRVQIGIPKAPAASGQWWAYSENPIVVIKDNVDQSLKLSLSWLYNGDTNAATRDLSRTLVLKFVDRDGVDRTLSAEYVFPVGEEYMNIDIKVFLPKDGPAQLVAAPLETTNPPIVNTSLTVGRGYYDIQPDQTLAVNSYDGVTPTNCLTRYMRVGIGNKITTARP